MIEQIGSGGNVLLIFFGVEVENHAIPILWLVMNRAGNTNTQQRIALLNRFIRWFGKENILGVLADREFVGKQWFQYLNERELPFYIRIKGKMKTTNIKGLIVNVAWLFDDLKPGEKRYLRGKRKLNGSQVYLTGARSIHGGELMVVASNQADENAIDKYLNRWSIETFFGTLKTRGFNFEQTRLLKRNRMKKLIAVLALTYCWSIKIGLWRHFNEPIILKKHQRRAMSLFRYGIDWIFNAFIQTAGKQKKMLKHMCYILQQKALSLSQPWKTSI